LLFSVSILIVPSFHLSILINHAYPHDCDDVIQRGMHEVFTGGLSSHSVLYMVVNFIQVCSGTASFFARLIVVIHITTIKVMVDWQNTSERLAKYF
jgi:DNA polymerase sigma